MKTKLIVVAGPTASGKTALGIALAGAVHGEIICADSMQVYRGMPIATAAPTPLEQEMAPHHLNAFLDPSTPFSVAEFCRLAREKIDEITSRGHVPILVGGTGLFIDSLVDNIRFTQGETDFALRSQLLATDAGTLYSRLQQVDPQAAQAIHPNNKVRVVRALELFYTTGQTKTRQDADSRQGASPYDTLYCVLAYQDRDKLYDRINRRADAMLANGLVEEARGALAKNGPTARQAIGHKELQPYLDGTMPLDEAADRLKQETRRYAKRQITWFKRRRNAVVLFADTMTQAALAETARRKAEEFLHGKAE